MASSISIDGSELQSLPTSAFVPPTLGNNEHFHMFLSYSSTDSRWTHELVDRLERTGLRVCYHERDFVPGRSILENMSECIQQSQKVVLVLSAEFMRSRWCLLEANMSLFRDCLERKPIVPVLLESDVCVPLHLCHLTYIEADYPDFMNKLLQVLCTPNRDLRGSSVVPYQPPSIYNGKALAPLTAADEERLSRWGCGVFSDMEVPDQLRLIVQNEDTYRQAIGIINNVSQTQVWHWSFWKGLLAVVLIITIFFLTIAFATYYVIIFFIVNTHDSLHIPLPLTLKVISLALLYALTMVCTIPIGLWKKDEGRRIVSELQKAVGRANILLSKDKILMGCRSNSKILLVYVSLDGCRQEFQETFSELACAEEMFQRAILLFSSGYTCCLAKKHFPFSSTPPTGHLPGLVCFCQYVCQQLDKNQWHDL